MYIMSLQVLETLAILFCFIFIVSSQDTTQGLCSVDEWQCSEGQCIEAIKECDGELDCDNEGDEDEEHCASRYPQRPQCPDMCDCTGVLEAYFNLVNCSGAGLAAVPQKLGHIVSELAGRWLFKTPTIDLVDLSNNDVSTVTGGMFSDMKIWTLNLSGNDISSVSEKAFTGIEGLHTLDLSRNKLSAIPQELFKDLEKLHWLDLSNNEISKLDSDVFNAKTGSIDELAVLKLQNNKLMTLPERVFRTLSKLRFLDLSGNDLIMVPHFNNPWSLEKLFLHDNNIGELTTKALENMGRLEKLSLQDNRITAVSSDAFNDLKSVKFLRLDNNAISHLPEYLFSQMDKLETLLLHNNEITNLPENLFESTGAQNVTLKELFLHNNDIRDIRGNPFSHMLLLHTVTSDTAAICCLLKSAEAVKGADCWPAFGMASCEGLIGSQALKILTWVVGGTCLLGNFFVLVWLLCSKGYHYLIGNLAVSDLLMGAYLIFIAVMDLQYGEGYSLHDLRWRSSLLCAFAGFLGTFAGQLSVATLILMAIDRFVAICTGGKALGSHALMGILLVFWILTVILCAVPFLVPQFGDFYQQSAIGLPLPIPLKIQDSISVQVSETGANAIGVYGTVNATASVFKPDGWEYSVLIFVVINGAAFFVIFILSVLMCLCGCCKNPDDTVSAAQLKDDKLLAKKMILISLFDFLCWAPVIAGGVNCYHFGYAIHPQVYACVAVMELGLKSALNPILYLLLSKCSREKEYDTVELEMAPDDKV